MLEPCRFVNCLERILVSKAGGVYDVSVFLFHGTVDFWYKYFVNVSKSRYVCCSVTSSAKLTCTQANTNAMGIIFFPSIEKLVQHGDASAAAAEGI